MKWGWRWTMGSSAFQHFTSSNLIQPSSPSYMLPSHAMELSSEPEWWLLQMLCWKAREYTHAGQAIEVWVCAQRRNLQLMSPATISHTFHLPTQRYYLPPTTLDSSFSKVLAPLAIAVYNGLHHWNRQDLPVLNPLRSQNQCY